MSRFRAVLLVLACSLPCRVLSDESAGGDSNVVVVEDAEVPPVEGNMNTIENNGGVIVIVENNPPPSGDGGGSSNGGGDPPDGGGGGTPSDDTNGGGGSSNGGGGANPPSDDTPGTGNGGGVNPPADDDGGNPGTGNDGGPTPPPDDDGSSGGGGGVSPPDDDGSGGGGGGGVSPPDDDGSGGGGGGATPPPDDDDGSNNGGATPPPHPHDDGGNVVVDDDDEGAPPTGNGGATPPGPDADGDGHGHDTDASEANAALIGAQVTILMLRARIEETMRSPWIAVGVTAAGFTTGAAVGDFEFARAQLWDVARTVAEDVYFGLEDGSFVLYMHVDKTNEHYELALVDGRTCEWNYTAACGGVDTPCPAGLPGDNPSCYMQWVVDDLSGEPPCSAFAQERAEWARITNAIEDWATRWHDKPRRDALFGETICYLTNSGEGEGKPQPVAVYDPRARSWYIDAATKATPMEPRRWTPPYLSFSGVPVLTATQAIYAANSSELLGVSAYDFPVSILDGILEVSTKDCTAFITDADGFLIAASVPGESLHGTNNQAFVTNATTPLIAAAGESIILGHADSVIIFEGVNYWILCVDIGPVTSLGWKLTSVTEVQCPPGYHASEHNIGCHVDDIPEDRPFDNQAPIFLDEARDHEDAVQDILPPSLTAWGSLPRGEEKQEHAEVSGHRRNLRRNLRQ